MLFWNQLSLQYITSFHIEMGRYACWNMSNAMLTGQIQYAAGQSGKREGCYTTQIIKINFAALLPNVRKSSYSINEKPFYTVVQLPEVHVRLY